jgi:tetratricopeptide (TPR) repeat protein
LARVNTALQETTRLRGLAQGAAVGNVTPWVEALAAAKKASALLEPGSDPALQRQVEALLAVITTESQAAEAAARAAESDRRLLDKLVDIRSATADDLDGSATDASYADAFRAAGIDVLALPPGEAGLRIKARSTAVATSLAAALDDWATLRRGRRKDLTGANRLTTVAREADPDPWRNQLREVLEKHRREQLTGALHRLAQSAGFGDSPALSLTLLGTALRGVGDVQLAETVLRQGQRRYPRDVWLNYELAQCLESQGRRDEAIGYYMAARSIRPETAHELAHALEKKGRSDEAIAVFEDLVRLRPDDGRHWGCYGHLLQERGNRPGSLAALGKAVASLRETIRLQPDDTYAHTNLGLALSAQGKPAEAIAAYREAIRLRPDHAKAHNNLGITLAAQGKQAEAIAEYRTALHLQPDLTAAHNNLGLALKAQGKVAEAIAEYREAIRLQPDHALAHTNLGLALSAQGKQAEAIAECREAIRLRPDHAKAHVNLGALLCQVRDYPAAESEFREAIRLKPDFAEAHCNLGITLAAQGKQAEAIVAYREAIRLKPDFAEAHVNLGALLCDRLRDYPAAESEFREAIRLRPDDARAHSNLGLTLSAQGKQAEAIAEYCTAIRLNPDHAAAHSNLGNALKAQGKVPEAIAEYRAAIRLNPDYAEAHCNLGNALRAQGKQAEAIAEYREAIRLRPDHAEAHVNLGALLCDQLRDYPAAESEFRTAIHLKPDHAAVHSNLGNALSAQGKVAEAIAEFRTAIRLRPDDAKAHCNLGHILKRQGKFEEALGELRSGHELGSKRPDWRYPSAQWVRDAEQAVALAPRLPAVLKGDDTPKDADEGLALAQLCYDTGRYSAATRFFAEALKADLKLAEDRQTWHRYNAACAAALAGCGRDRDDPPPDEAARARLRRQAREWLKAERAAWAKQLESGPPQARPVIVQTLQHWKADSDLAGIRDETELKKLPEDEQRACRADWAEVDALLARARIGTSP